MLRNVLAALVTMAPCLWRYYRSLPPEEGNRNYMAVMAQALPGHANALAAQAREGVAAIRRLLPEARHGRA